MIFDAETGGLRFPAWVTIGVLVCAAWFFVDWLAP